ncbi:MAG: AbrB/MazE/SpoVT family DNA-binding domain-containing protein [Deltaproteobacteria bacterium]|nr:AbrB/MazE/SpoVT family DNA-binding domain-containing protein [Deltaproteobacteria bacterium]
MRVSQKGQVTIPQDIREKAGILPETEVEFVFDGERIYLEKREGTSMRGRTLLNRMRGKATVRMSTDEIMALTRGDE